MTTDPTSVNVGSGDDSDVEAGRCCPTCRHDLTPHNVKVWNAGYAVAVRHEDAAARVAAARAEAWDEGYGDGRLDESINSTTDNPYRAVVSREPGEGDKS